MTFWSGAGLILLIVLLRFLWAALRARQREVRAANDVYRAQQDALARAAADDEIASAHLPGLQTELARATLEDAAREFIAPKPISAEERYGLGLLVMLVLPAIAIPLYLQFGTPTPPAAAASSAHLTPTEMIAELQARIARAPRDPEPRMWLARVYMASARYGDAVAVFEELHKLVPDQPAILLQYADALAMTQNGAIGEQATALIQRALELEPDNMTGLWLAGVAADQAGQAREALDYLQRARQAGVATETPTAELDALIAEVETRSGLKAAPFAVPAGQPAPAATPAVAASAASIAVDVAVDATAVAGLPPESVVFVLAKAVNGPPMPLAVKRLTLADLPLRVTLDDSLAMAPQFRLSSVEEVTVTARISRSGEPTAQAGDVEGRSGPLRVGTDVAVNVTIDTQVR